MMKLRSSEEIQAEYEEMLREYMRYRNCRGYRLIRKAVKIQEKMR